MIVFLYASTYSLICALERDYYSVQRAKERDSQLKYIVMEIHTHHKSRVEGNQQKFTLQPNEIEDIGKYVHCVLYIILYLNRYGIPFTLVHFKFTFIFR